MAREVGRKYSVAFWKSNEEILPRKYFTVPNASDGSNEMSTEI